MTSDPLQEDERRPFRYESAGRVDPFRPPIDEGGVTGSYRDIELRGTIEHAERSRSIAIFTQRGTSRRIRAVVGQRIGDMRIVGIADGRVDVVVEDLGVSRRETITLGAVGSDAAPENRR